MSKEQNKSVCSVENAGGLDNSFRKLLQNPDRILKPYISTGMSVLDVGCGPGFFTVEIAKLLNGSGKVIAADLQQGMLDIIRKKVNGTELEKIISFHKCSLEGIGLKEKVDFILAFYMVHEVPDHDKLFRELKSFLKPNGQILVIEPMGHVSKAAFEAMTEKIKAADLKIIARPKFFFSRAIVLSNN
jgi:ubiquinone/menaquinone biosynthesis C-methylase UbiE